MQRGGNTMKKTKYIRFLFGLGIFGMAALFLAIAPVQSWGGDIVNCDNFTGPNAGDYACEQVRYCT